MRLGLGLGLGLRLGIRALAGVGDVSIVPTSAILGLGTIIRAVIKLQWVPQKSRQ